MKLRRTNKLDDLDAKIVESLQVEGRSTNVEIARRLGVAEGTVRNRIERLIEDEVINIGAWADPLKIGYQIYMIFEIRVALAERERVAERLAQFSEIFFLGSCTGVFDVFAAACFRSSEHLREFVTGRLASVPGISAVNSSTMMEIVKRSPPSPAIETSQPDGHGKRRVPRARGRGGRSAARPRQG